MTVTTFDPSADLIFVQAYVWGPRGQERELRLVLDTGAGATIIAPDILDELGYSTREHGEQVAITVSALSRTRVRTRVRIAVRISNDRPHV